MISKTSIKAALGIESGIPMPLSRKYGRSTLQNSMENMDVGDSIVILSGTVSIKSARNIACKLNYGLVTQNIDGGTRIWRCA